MLYPKMPRDKAERLIRQCELLIEEAVFRGLLKDAESQRKRMGRLKSLISRYPPRSVDTPTLANDDGGPK